MLMERHRTVWKDNLLIVLLLFRKLNIDYIEVNLSVAQCMQANLVQEVLETLEKYHVSPDQINLEITETATSHSTTMLNQNLTELTNAGIKFSLDDFGTGYSSLSYLQDVNIKRFN